MLITNYMSVSLAGCGADARFLLEAMACRALRDGADEMPGNAKALAKWLHVSERMVSGALGELVACGVVCRLSRAVGRGRPVVTYRIVATEMALLMEKKNSDRAHGELLERLFSGDDLAVEMLGAAPKTEAKRAAVTRGGKPAPPGARGRLSASNRLLLGTLLARADSFGQVTGVSNLDLIRLTGLDAESLKHRLKRLLAVGMIRSYVPGASSSVFRAGKISSTYFLNLNHPAFGLKRNCAVVVHQLGWEDERRISHEESLWRDVRRVSRSGGGVRTETPLAVIRFLAGQKGVVFRLLQFMLLQYASELLARHWHEIGTKDFVDDGWVRERIEGNLRKPSTPEGGQDDADKEWKAVIAYFHGEVFKIARDFRSRFGQADWIEFDSGGLSILPVLQDTGYSIITVLLQPPPRAVSECTVLLEERPGVVNPESYNAEADIDLGMRIHYGLATYPARRLMMK
ncbi:hypothetical protein [Stutzerimonas kirkiae]|uniref:hypothetical protein n=1 Tax=Stutzerimonas kirkiae TaxID=2211392 RepID=UPI00103830FD|nr:hypothetical protein [Stutzerimonas kirkiae]